MDKLEEALAGLDKKSNVDELAEKGKRARELIMGATIPEDLWAEIKTAYGAVKSATEQVQSLAEEHLIWIVSDMVVREYLEEGNRFFFMRRTPFGWSMWTRD